MISIRKIMERFFVENEYRPIINNIGKFYPSLISRLSRDTAFFRQNQPTFRHLLLLQLYLLLQMSEHYNDAC